MWTSVSEEMGSCQGIHEYKDMGSLLEDVKKKQFDYAKKECGAAVEDFKDIKICEYKTPNFGCSSDEFIANIVSKSPKDIISKDNS